jgi:two-component system sensor histidine kinase/response regulator
MKSAKCVDNVKTNQLTAMARQKILIVEDNRADQFALTQLLIKFDYLAEVAATGEKAVELLQRSTFAAILMDISLPEMDGFECTARLRLLEKKSAKHTPIIALSAWIGQDINDKCLAAGMDDYVSKPVHPEHLRRVLLRHVYDPSTPNLKTLAPLPMEELDNT